MSVVGSNDRDVQNAFKEIEDNLRKTKFDKVNKRWKRNEITTTKQKKYYGNNEIKEKQYTGSYKSKDRGGNMLLKRWKYEWNQVLWKGKHLFGSGVTWMALAAIEKIFIYIYSINLPQQRKDYGQT